VSAGRSFSVELVQISGSPSNLTPSRRQHRQLISTLLAFHPSGLIIHIHHVPAFRRVKGTDPFSDGCQYFTNFASGAHCSHHRRLPCRYTLVWKTKYISLSGYTNTFQWLPASDSLPWSAPSKPITSNVWLTNSQATPAACPSHLSSGETHNKTPTHIHLTDIDSSLRSRKSTIDTITVTIYLEPRGIFSSCTLSD
jgi:hypothetical protein